MRDTPNRFPRPPRRRRDRGPALPLAQGAQAAASTPVAPTTAAVGRPSQVHLVDSDFVRSHLRVEVRYGDAPRSGPASSPRRRC
ncbi:hypothetical protein HXP44_13325 [Streptomyces sioyaensis]|uniref:Uncharacterized protein n=1 Tax=Streptomyces sioyaensis TaxID=67364 RepID=A0A4Q1R8C4_9ACTN|nr:hypothetical protein [Streptomyces sioyaensis]MBM4793007.1 hypothetical protein [Streptomyces sioyaensis]RXS69617.1 hypothetical protein EST54_05170 [Streptomyces sioyaensis]